MEAHRRRAAFTTIAMLVNAALFLLALSLLMIRGFRLSSVVSTIILGGTLPILYRARQRSSDKHPTPRMTRWRFATIILSVLYLLGGLLYVTGHESRLLALGLIANAIILVIAAVQLVRTSR